MKTIFLALLCLFSSAKALETLVVKGKTVHTIASFEQVDYFSTHTEEGEFLWEISFGTQIQSFEETEERLFVLSKMRDGSAFFLSCFDTKTGKPLWEKGIVAPKPKDE